MALNGYTPWRWRAAVFTVGAAIAGLAGGLFAAWAKIVTTGLFSLTQAAEALIWTLAGGLGSLRSAQRWAG